MKIVVIGGTGRVGSKVVGLLDGHGHFPVAASPNTGVNTITGEGLLEAFQGADAVVDLSNSPSFADDEVMEFFTTSTKNQLEAERAAGVKHHVALSIVGCDRIPDSGYLRAKVAQEKLIKESGQPYSIVRATQLFEFSASIGEAGIVDGISHVSTGIMQPISAADAAVFVAQTSDHAPINGTFEVGGPEKIAQDDFVRRAFAGKGEQVEVVGDPSTPYFGAVITGDELVPGPDGRLGATTFDYWIDGKRWLNAHASRAN